MDTTLDRQEPEFLATRPAPHIELERSNTGYGADVFDTTRLCSLTAATPIPMFFVQLASQTRSETSADDVAFLPPTHSQRMRLRIVSTGVGTMMPDKGE